MSSERSDIDFEIPEIGFPSVNQNPNKFMMDYQNKNRNKNKNISEKRLTPSSTDCGDTLITPNSLLIFLFIVVVAMIVYLSTDKLDINLDRTANVTTEKQLLQ
jgi:hypothetical protein